MTFANETASGWQTAHFATPVVLQVGVNYVISVHANSVYADTLNFFPPSVQAGPLSAPAGSVYQYGPGGFSNTGAATPQPVVFNHPSNYMVDPIFSAARIYPNFSSCNFATPTTFAHTWYIDPVNGQKQNAMTSAGISLEPTVTPHQGDKQHPWLDLNALAISKFNVVTGVTGYPNSLLASGIIKPGDLILLESGTAAQYGVIKLGDNGFPTNAAGPFITVEADAGASVTFAQLGLGNFSDLHVSGVNVQGANKTPLLIFGAGKNDVVDNITLSSMPDAQARTLTQDQWKTTMSNGVYFGVGSCYSLTHSHLTNLATGVEYTGATSVVFDDNEIDHMSGDGMDYHDDDLEIARNSIHDMVNDGTGEHLDGMQGVIGIPSVPISHRIHIFDNTVVFQRDPNLEFQTMPAPVNGAIDITNNPWVNLYIDNNRIYWTNFVRAISFGNCTNCGVENNTLAGGFILTVANDTNVVIKNNLVDGLSCTAGDGVQMTNNVMYKGGSGFTVICANGTSFSMSGGGVKPGSYLGGNIVDNVGVLGEIKTVDAVNFVYDFSLIPGAPAIGFGAPVDFTPALDSLGNPLNSPVDAGAIQAQP